MEKQLIREQHLRAVEGISSFEEADPVVKQVITAHILMPALTKSALANHLQVDVSLVRQAFRSKAFEEVILEIGKQDILEMTLLATETLRSLLLNSHSSTRIKAALAVLHEKGIIQVDRGLNKPVVNQAIVFWGDKPLPNGKLNAPARD